MQLRPVMRPKVGNSLLMSNRMNTRIGHRRRARPARSGRGRIAAGHVDFRVYEGGHKRFVYAYLHMASAGVDPAIAPGAGCGTLQPMYL